MDGIVYLTWVSIPITLLLLALLARAAQRWLPSGEEDPNRPPRIIRLATVFALYAVACVFLDRFVLDPLFSSPQSAWSLSVQAMGALRASLLPVVALMGSFVFLVARALNPRPAFDRLRVDVRGSHPLYLLAALSLLAILIWDRGQEQGASFSLSGTHEIEHKAEGTPSPKDSTKALIATARSFVGQVTENSAKFADELRAIAGVAADATSAAPPPPLKVAPGDRPDFNAEGAASFGPIVREIALSEGVDPALVSALIEIASGYNQRWVSKSGNHGLMGLRPNAIAAYGERDLYNIHQNVRIGCRELKKALEAGSGDIRVALLLLRYGSAESVDMPPEQASDANDFVTRTIAVYDILAAKDSSPP